MTRIFKKYRAAETVIFDSKTNIKGCMSMRDCAATVTGEQFSLTQTERTVLVDTHPL